MLKFPPYFARVGYEMCRILLSQHAQGIFELVLLDVAMSCEISARWAMFDQVMFGQESLGTRVVARGEMDLSEEEGVVGIA